MFFKSLRNFALLAGCVCFLGGCSEESESPSFRKSEIRYGTDDLNRLDVCTPTVQPDGHRPVFIYVHGGGWNQGDKSELQAWQIEEFIDNGFLCVSVNYRLSPYPVEPKRPDRVQHPRHIQDVAQAVAWVVGNISRYGGDPTRLILAGHSAGSHLAALAVTNQKYLQAEGVDIEYIRGVCVLDGGGYLTMTDDVIFANSTILECVYNAVGDESNRDAWFDFAPGNHITEGKYIPPMLLIHSDDGIRVASYDLLKRRLDLYDHRYKEYTLPGYSHGDVLWNFPTYPLIDIIADLKSLTTNNSH